MQLKRKGVDDGVLPTDPGSTSDQLPSKKLKQDWGSPFPAIYETANNSMPNFVENRPVVDEPIVEVCPVEIPNDTPVDNSVSTSLFVTEPDADDRALVLYKPMNPSVRSHIQVNGTFPRHYKDFQVSDAVDWFSPSRSFKQDSALTHGKGVTSNSLAVIPYVAPYSGGSTGVDAYGGGLIIEDITDQVREEEEQGDPMVVEEPTPMEEEGEQMDVSDAVPQFGCDYPQWQQSFGSPQYTPVMWS